MRHQSQSSTKHYIRGGQVTFHNIRMFIQVNKVILKILLFLFIGGVLGYLYCFSESERLLAGVYHYVGRFLFWLFQYNKVFHLSFPHQGQWVPETQFTLLRQPFFFLSAHYLWSELLKAVLLSGSVVIALFLMAIRWFTQKGEKQNSRQFIRGSQLWEAKQVKKAIQRDKKASDLHIDGFPLIAQSETQHFLVHGTVGTGKSQLIQKVLDGLRRRGDRVIVYDKGCSFIQRYFKAGDMLLNPFDARCAPWDLWEEAPTSAHLENMAESLIPLHGETDPFWVNAARTVFSSTAQKMRNDPDRSLEKLLQVLLTGEFEDLESYIKGTEGATLVSGKIEKTAISIRSIITTYLKSLRFLCGVKTPESGAFSIRQWLANEAHSNWLFISADGENQAALRPLISMWMAMASLNILSLPENPERRIWVVCDEISSLHKLPLLPETIAEVRKFGGCFLLGMQSEAQMEKVYGRSAAKEIFDLLNTRFFFRSPSSDMAKLVSSELGEMEIEDPNENYSYGANSIRDGISMTRQRVVRPIVTYDEIISLPKMTCYLRLPENYAVTKLKLKLEKRPIVAPHLLLREIPEIPLVEKNALESSTALPPEMVKKKKKKHPSKEKTEGEKHFVSLNEQEPSLI